MELETHFAKYAKDDREWSQLVKQRADCHCEWMGCSNFLEVDPHHIIGRANKQTRLLVQNGICLCRKHHNQVETLSKQSGQYDKVIRLLIGEKRWNLIQKVLYGGI